MATDHQRRAVRHRTKVQAQKGNGLREQLERIWREGPCRQPDHRQVVMTYGLQLAEARRRGVTPEDPYMVHLEELALKHGEDTVVTVRGKKVPPPKRVKIEWA
jgi:hypothetical protein